LAQEPEAEPPPQVPAPRSAPRAPERALALHDEARKLYAQGRYQDAVDKLEEAIAVDPNAKVLYYNIALIEERIGDLDSALDHYRNCLQLETSESERVKLAHIIKRIEGARTHVSQNAPKAAAEPASNTRTAPQPEPVQHDKSLAPWIWASGSVTVAALIVGAALAGHAASLEPDAATSADVSVDDLRHDAEAAHDFAIGADVAFSIAIVAGVVTVVLVAVTLASGDDRAEQPLAWRF
jgi:tetratricopeptide (TPR) repeat protein